MTVPEGIACKIQRAEMHHQALDAEVQAFLQADPKPYRIVAEDDPESGDRVYRMEIVRPPPAIEWGVSAGDVIHNLRSALDHLAYALCLAYSPHVMPPAGTEFPIFADEDLFSRADCGAGFYKIRGMSDGAQEAVRGLQPYQHGDSAKSQSLWLLQEMSNIDKHRHLHLSVIGHPGISFFVDPHVDITPVWSDDQSVIARARRLTPDAEITDPLIHPQIVLDDLPRDDWRPLDVQVHVFVGLVTEIVEDFSARFLTSSADRNP
jgi:hypothetical protein